MPEQLCMYTDSDHANDLVDRRSVSGVLLKVGDSVVHWISRKQTLVSTSTVEAELNAVCEGFVYFHKLTELYAAWMEGQDAEIHRRIYVDNQPLINAIHSKTKGRTKAYDIKAKRLSE